MLKSEYAPAGRSILAQLNHKAIKNEIVNGPLDKLRFAYDQAAEMVWAVGERLLARDTEWLELDGIEEGFAAGGDHGILDQRGRFTSAAPEALQGKTFVRDWKTTGRELNLDWEEGYRCSWQWQIYLYYTGADVFVYTGVSAKDNGVREFYIHRPADLDLRVVRQMSGMQTLQDAVVAAGLEVYPQNMPDGCKKYGGCQFKAECLSNTMPRMALPAWLWSPSGMDTWLTCPEKFRRNRVSRIANVEQVGSESAELGSAFHRGIAEVYRQVYGITKSE